jgi:hypothetical protein
MENSSEEKPFPTMIFQTVFIAVVIATFMSYITKAIIPQYEISVREFFDNLFVLSPIILGVSIWYKIHGKTATKLRVTRIRVGKLEIRSSQVVYSVSLVLVYATFALIDEVFPLLSKAENATDFIVLAAEEAWLFTFSISILSILVIILSFSLRKRIPVIEVVILWIFTLFFISSLLLQVFEINIDQWPNGNKTSIFLVYLFVVVGLSKIWNLRRIDRKGRREEGTGKKRKKEIYL